MVKAAKQPDELVLACLGGAGEIGMNAYLYGLGGDAGADWLMVDCGVRFGDETTPGIELILPDPQFIVERAGDLAGIVITHAHEDHIGALPWLWPRLRAPVYCTAFASELLGKKLLEHGLEDDVEVNVVDLPGRVRVGPFEVEYVPVTHSIPESAALAIRTPVGVIVHSGDWKLDRAPVIAPHIDEARFRHIGEEGVEALVCDSTNVLRPGHSPTESEVGDSLARIIAEAQGRVAVTTFASQVGRIHSVVKAARAAGREVVVAGRAMRTVIEAARSVGLLADAGSFLDEEAFAFLPKEKTLLLCTGSQGEARAATARIAAGAHPRIALEPGDVVIFSSRTIPGNEKAVAQVLNDLAGLGVEVITSDDHLIHTSGHPRQGELKEFYSWLKPSRLVPMHGELRHLARHRQFAAACGIDDVALARNGEVVRLIPGPAEVVGEIASGRLHVDGRLIAPDRDGPARARRRLSFAGIVTVSLVIDGKGNVIDDPRIVCDGLPENDAAGVAVEDLIIDVLDAAIDAMPRARRRNDEAVITLLRSAVRKQCERIWGKKPVCHVVVHRV